MRQLKIWLATLIICGGTTLWGGCSDDDSTGENNNNNVVWDDAGVDAGPDAATGDSLEFIVLDGTDPAVSDASALRLAGAVVAFDLPGGERVERTSGADGHVTIHGIDWTLGEAAMTVYKDNYAMFSVVGIDADTMVASSNPYIHEVEGVPALYLMLLALPVLPELTVTGTATQLVDPAHDYMVFTARSTATTYWNGAGTDDFSIVAPENEPFTLIGIENTEVMLPSGQGTDYTVHRAMELNVEPTAGPTLAVELDFQADELPVHTADASMVLPTRADSPLRDGMGYFFVGYKDGFYSIGWGSPIDISVDGNRFEGQISWIEPTLVEDPFQFFMVQHGSTGARSVAIEPGYPQGIAVDPPLYDVPKWVTPSDPMSYYPLHDPMQWELFNNCPVVVLTVQRSGFTVWRVRAQANATTMTVPQPPSTVNVNSFLGPSFQAFLSCMYAEPGELDFERLAESPIVRLSRE